MNRNEFIKELRHRLKRLPQEETENAVSYYEEYFNDAGAENEARTIEALGSPLAVASRIIGEYAINDTTKVKARKRNVMLITILAVCASPVALPLALALAVIVLSVGIVFLAVTVSFASVALAGFLTVVIGFWAFTADFATRVLYLGLGLFVTALGAAITWAIMRLGKLSFRGLQIWLGKILIRRSGK